MAVQQPMVAPENLYYCFSQSIDPTVDETSTAMTFYFLSLTKKLQLTNDCNL